jgi:hypothetical protein
MVSQHSTPHDVTTPPLEAALHENSSPNGHDGADNFGPSNAGDQKFQKQPLTIIVLLTITSLMAMFLIALDRTIITTVR